MAQPLPKHRAREYETIFIVHPESSSEILDQVAGRVTDVIGKLDGKLLRAENWGKRRLAYPVKKQAQGVYVYLRYLGYSDMVHEIERNFRMIEPVIKYLTVKVDEDVDPAARPVNEADISFVPMFEDETEIEKSGPADDADDADDADEDYEDDEMDQDEEVDRSRDDDGDDAHDEGEDTGDLAAATEEKISNIDGEVSSEATEATEATEASEVSSEPPEAASDSGDTDSETAGEPNEPAETDSAPEGDESETPESTDEKED